MNNKSSFDLQKIHKLALPTYNSAGEIALNNFRKNLKYKVKVKDGYESIVTKVDKEIDSLLTSELTKILPGSGFLSEEQEATLSDHFNWVIDPIDGTGNYQVGVDLWGQFVSLKDKDETVYAAMLYPTLMNKIIYGFKGLGVLDSAGDKLLLNDNKNFKVKFACDSSDPKFKKATYALDFGPRVSVMQPGSVAFNSYSLLRGGYDFMLLYKLPLYDINAISFLAELMGFKVEFFNSDYQHLDPDSTRSKYKLLISKPVIYPEIINKVKGLIYDYEKNYGK